jgi:hypothetical protein
MYVEMAMQKIQVFLRADQKKALRAIASRTGEKQSDLVRKGVDLVVERATAQTADWREATRAAAGVWRGRKDIDTLQKKMRAAAKRRFASLYGAR